MVSAADRSKAAAALAALRWAGTTPEERKAASEKALAGRRKGKRTISKINRQNAKSITPEAAKARGAKIQATKRRNARAAKRRGQIT